MYLEGDDKGNTFYLRIYDQNHVICSIILNFLSNINKCFWNSAKISDINLMEKLNREKILAKSDVLLSLYLQYIMI